MFKKLIGTEEERAVSPVIGVILMVAITVILAAVIAAFVLDLGGSVGQDAQAGVSIDGDQTSDVTVTWTSEGNSDAIYIVYEDDDEDPDNQTITSVGSTATFDGDNVNETGSYTVVALIGEGAENTDEAETATVIDSFELE